MSSSKDRSAFWDRVARRYEKMPVRNPASYETTLDRVRAHLGPEDHVLELGCGTGSTALLLAPSVAHYTAADISAEMIAIAREKQAKAEIENVVFHISELDDGSLPMEPLDAVLAFNVLHLFPDRPAIFAEVLRRLRPGGLFISKTPCLGGRYRVLQPLVASLRFFGKAPKLAFLKPASLQQEVTDAGFEIIEHGDYPARPPSRFIVAKKRFA
jgi:ubiquinone/menaquinone biosynthesis C-methylase UbiE